MVSIKGRKVGALGGGEVGGGGGGGGGGGAPGLAGESGGEETGGRDGFRETARAVPEGGSSTLAAGLIVRDSFSVPLRLPNTTILPRGQLILPATSRSGATGTNPAAFWSRPGLSTVARSAETSRWYDDWRRFPLSSGHCWPPSRIFAGPTEWPPSPCFRLPSRIPFPFFPAPPVCSPYL